MFTLNFNIDHYLTHEIDEEAYYQLVIKGKAKKLASAFKASQLSKCQEKPAYWFFHACINKEPKSWQNAYELMEHAKHNNSWIITAYGFLLKNTYKNEIKSNTPSSKQVEELFSRAAAQANPLAYYGLYKLYFHEKTDALSRFNSAEFLFKAITCSSSEKLEAYKNKYFKLELDNLTTFYQSKDSQKETAQTQYSLYSQPKNQDFFENKAFFLLHFALCQDIISSSLLEKQLKTMYSLAQVVLKNLFTDKNYAAAHEKLLQTLQTYKQTGLLSDIAAAFIVRLIKEKKIRADEGVLTSLLGQCPSNPKPFICA